MYIIYLGCKVRHMKTRKILFKKYKKVGRHLKIHKGGRSSGSRGARTHRCIHVLLYTLHFLHIKRCKTKTKTKTKTRF